MWKQALRVLHICQRDDLATGGAARVAVEYVKRLPAHNVDAHCLFLYGRPGPFQSELGNERTHYLGISSSKEFLKFGRFIRFLWKFNPQIIHCHDGLLWSHLLTFFHPGVVKIAHAHLGAKNGPVWSKGSMAAWFQRHSTDMLVCITEYTRQSQIEQGNYSPDRTRVIYNGVDRERFYPPTVSERLQARKHLGLPDDAYVVGFVGRLHCAMKGVDDFLRVIALLPEDFWGVVVGSGPDADYLKGLTRELDLTERVIFTGILENPTLAYHAMDIFCLTSHYEPFGLVVAEAMACQTPVIGFLCDGGVNEILTPETGWIVEKRTLTTMAQVITKVVEDSELTKNKLARAWTFLDDKFSWERNTASLARLYRTLLGFEVK